MKYRPCQKLSTFLIDSINVKKIQNNSLQMFTTLDDLEERLNIFNYTGSYTSFWVIVNHEDEESN